MADAGHRVWFVTGAGRGLGRAFTVAALERGDRVVATARRPVQLDDLLAVRPGRLQVLELDVRDRSEVLAAVTKAVEAFGRLDVVVNNAGYGTVGMAEELTEPEIRAHLDTNLLGAVWVSQAVLPVLRDQGSGHIVQISTVGAVGSMPGFGLYNAGKWALEGFSEALAGEVAPFGVRVTIAELGGFATDWAGSSLEFAVPNAAYDQRREELFGTREIPWPTPEESTPTDAPPAVAAAALLAHVDATDGPLRLLVGDDAPTLVAGALARRRDDYAADPRFRWP